MAAARAEAPGASPAGEAHLGGLYRSVFQSLADALIVIDDRGLIRSFSPSAERMFGWTSAEVEGRNVSVLMPAPDRDQHDQYVRRYVEAGWASGVMESLLLTGDAHIIRPERETVAVRRDGTSFPARLIVSEVEAEGNRMFVGLISDVSERKRLEGELAAQVESQTALLRQLESAYAVIEAQKARMQYELDVGRQIQLSMVPHVFPPRAEADLWATLQPAREVGGDFYDWLSVRPGELWMVIGDVSGKGVPAALLMAVTKTLVRFYAVQGGTPAEVLTQVNAELSRDNEQGMFVTVFLACLDLASGTLHYTNAGHNPPLVRRVDGRLERYGKRHGLVVGALEGAQYRESVDRLVPGDTLLLFTDGVTEALGEGGELFSEARLRGIFLEGAGQPAEQVATRVVAAVEGFAGSAEQFDDITVMALRYLGPEHAGGAPQFSLRIRNNFESLVASMPAIDSLVERCGGDDMVRHRFALAFDELLSNVIKYGFPDGGDHLIECEVARRGDAIVAVIADEGQAFNPLDRPMPDTSLPIEDRKIGGLGVLLVREMFDEVRYERMANRNVTTIALGVGHTKHPPA